MFKQSGTPKNINFDLGSEFIDRRMITYCEENGIKIWFSSANQDNKNAIIEGFHRTSFSNTKWHHQNHKFTFFLN